VKHTCEGWIGLAGPAFSILKRIGVGETRLRTRTGRAERTFSILKRIGVGETHREMGRGRGTPIFQYPQTDRSG